MSEEEKLNEIVEALEKEGVNPNDSITNIEIGNKVASVLNSFGVTPDAIEKWVGIKECGCKKRQKFLNGVLSFFKSPDTK